MRGRRQERIEAAIDRLASAIFGGAMFYAVFQMAASRLAWPQPLIAAAAAALLAYGVTVRALNRVVARLPKLDVPIFRVADLDLLEPCELLLTEQVELMLTDADRLRPLRIPSADELILDDILAELGPDSRVVRLFDAAAMPTPGQLKSRIDRHLDGGTPRSPSSDASQALYDALADLRRSLR